MFKKSTLLYFVVLMMTLAGLARAELLVNPGFEDSTPLADTWITWGGGDGEGGWWETYNATVKQDGTAHGGNAYLEAGLVDPGWSWWSWAGMWVWQEHPVIEGNTYQISGWLRAGDADGATLLIPDGAGVSLEWRYTAPVGGPTGQRGDEISRDTQLFDLTQDWTYVSIEATAPAGALGVSAGFFAGVGVNYDIDDALFMEVAPLPLVVNGSFEEDEAILDDPDWSQWCTWNPAEGAGSNATIVDTDFYDGARSLMIEPLGTEAGHFYVIYQPVALEVGREYVTTFWAKAAVPRPLGVTMKAADNSVSWVSTTFQLTTEWAEYSLSGVAENATAKIDFACAATNDTIWLDFVSVVGLEEAEPGPLVTNGSFEEDEAILDDPDGLAWWTWNPAEGAGSNVTIVDTEALDGARSLMIEPQGTDGWHFMVINSPMALEVGTSYVTTFWAKAAAPRPLHVQMKATDNSVTWGQADFDLTTDWVEYSASSVAENASAKLEFHCAATNDAIWLDFVSVEEEALLAPSILLNGSFEEDEVIQDDPDWSVWTTWGWEGGLEGRAMFDPNEAIHGDWSLRIEPRGGTDWFFIVLQADIPLDLDREYTITFWAKALAPRPFGVGLKAMDNSVTWNQGQFNLTTEWAEYSVRGIAANELAKMEFYTAATNDTVWLDNVTLRGAALPPSLVANGSFEEDEAILDDPDWAQWTTWNPPEGAGSNATIVDTDAVDGARSLMIEPRGGTDWFFMVLHDGIPLEVGKTYTTTFWAKAAAPRTINAQMKASDNSGDWGWTQFQLTTEWAEYSFSAPAANAAAKLEFHCAATNDTIWLDLVSVEIEEGPAPLVVNGSFEDDFAQWWTWGWEAGLSSTYEIDPSTSIDGTNSIRVDPVGGGENWFFMIINSPIPLDVGTTYTYSFWAKAAEPRTIGAKLKAEDNSVDWAETTFDLTTEWAEYTVTAEALNSSAKFELHCGNEISVWFDFVHVYEGEHDPELKPEGSETAGGPSPADGTLDVSRDVTLGWISGNAAVTHDVYLGTSFDDVSNADVTDTTGIYRDTLDLATTSYTPAESPLEWDLTYYWRIDEVNDADPNSPWKGSVWSFTTTNFVVVDDFESYNDIEFGQEGSNLIYLTWIDGFDNPTANGAVVGYTEAFQPSMETDDVHGGGQSVPLTYDNSTAGISEITRTLNADWTRDDVLTLTLFYKGSLSNDPEPMYVALNGVVIPHDNPKAAKASGWNQLDILLQDFADLGVNLASINTMTIGFGNKAGPTANGSGSVLIDDIRLYRSLPIEPEPGSEPVDPGVANLVASYSFEDNVQDVSGNGLDGTVWGNPFFVDGFVGKALAFDGVNDAVSAGNNAAFDITAQITISAWVKTNDAGNGQHNPYVGKGDHAYALKHASNNSIEFFIYDGGWHTANVSIDDSFNGEWHHVLGSYDGLEVKTYVDGVLGATNAHTGAIEVQTHNLTFAFNSEETDRYYSGLLDEVKIYDRALSKGEVRFLVGN